MHLGRDHRVRTITPAAWLGWFLHASLDTYGILYLFLDGVGGPEPVSKRDLRIILEVSSFLGDTGNIHRRLSEAIAGSADERHDLESVPATLIL
jgi:hypothetical protein